MSFLSQRSRGNKWMLLAAGIAALVVVVATLLLFFHKHTVMKTAAHTAAMGKYCVGQNLSIGSSGHCVSDIQTLVNFMERGGLTECKFDGSATLAVNGTFDEATKTQIMSIQNWADCYATQEGFKSNVKQTGSVDQSTWGELCTFGYSDPMQSDTANAAASIAAGTDAACPRLHK